MIDVDGFGDRFRGTVTVLLCLVALVSSVQDKMPKTAYFQFTELWFLWYITNILLIALFHICLNHIPKNKVDNIEHLDSFYTRKTNVSNARMKVNRLGMVLFGTITMMFNFIYYMMSVFKETV